MLTCSHCKQDYDSDQRLPNVIPTCGHTICSRCLSAILATQNPKECPECKKPLPLEANKEWFQTNFALIQILEMMSSLCPKHKAPKDQVCLADYQTICVNCANYDHDHKKHPTYSLQDVKIEAKTKIQEINQKEKSFNEKARHQIQQILQKSHDNTNEAIEKTVLKLKNDFTRRKRWFSWDLETLFALKKRKSIAKDPQIIQYKEENAGCCRTLTSNIMNTDYLQLLEKDIPQIPTYHQEQLKEFSTKIEIKVNMKKGETQEVFQQEDLLKDMMMEEITPYERLRINLEIAKRRYFDIHFDDDNTVLKITPKESCQSFLEFKQSITPEHISKITKISLNQQKTKFNDEMIYALDNIWESLIHLNNPDVEINYSHENFDGEKDLIQCEKFPLWRETEPQSPLITKLHLNFQDCLLDRSPFAKFLSQNLVKLQNLKELYLFRQRTPHIDDTIIISLADQVLPFLNSLETLCLWLDHSKVTDSGIIKLCAKLERLKALSLSFFDTQISDSSLFTLSTLTFTNSSDLEELNLYFPQTQITPSGVRIFFRNLSKLTKLRILSLAFGEISISEPAIAELTRDYLRSASTLQEVHIGFNNCQLSQDSLEMLCCYLPNQVSHLEIGFYNESAIDQNMKTLVTESLQHMLNLSTLGLRFHNTSLTLCGQDISILISLKFKFLHYFFLLYFRTNIINLLSFL